MGARDSTAQDGLDADFIAAVKADDVAAAQALLDAGADPDARLPNERAPLYTAVGNKSVAMVRLLAPRSRNINIQDSCDFTPFTQAVRLDLEEIANVLLDNGAQPCPSGKGADYPLDWAIACKRYALVTRILKESRWPDRLFKGEPVLVTAAESGDLELARACLAAGGRVDRAGPKSGATALHVAAKKGDAAFIVLLLDSGASGDARDAEDRTPFDWARFAGREKIFAGIIAEREMRAAAKSLTQGLDADFPVKRPLRLRRDHGLY